MSSQQIRSNKKNIFQKTLKNIFLYIFWAKLIFEGDMHSDQLEQYCAFYINYIHLNGSDLAI